MNSILQEKIKSNVSKICLKRKKKHKKIWIRDTKKKISVNIRLWDALQLRKTNKRKKYIYTYGYLKKSWNSKSIRQIIFGCLAAKKQHCQQHYIGRTQSCLYLPTTTCRDTMTRCVSFVQCYAGSVLFLIDAEQWNMSCLTFTTK